jgi:hypothetical protein
VRGDCAFRSGLERAGIANACVGRVFKTYFEEEGDPGDFDLLARDAETAGIMLKDEASFAVPREQKERRADLRRVGRLSPSSSRTNSRMR